MIETLSQLIAQVESSGDNFAIRFEPAYHPNPARVATLAHACDFTYNTSEILLACSWGCYQIMGDNLVDMGLRVSPAAYCASQDTQDKFFAEYCTRANCFYTLDEVISDEEKRLYFAHQYNGPGNVVAYAARMLAVYQKAQGQ